jgi:RHS repeat-associated protein
VTRYFYNADNQLVAAESNSGWRYEFQYDAFGRRTRIVGPQGETEFLWDGEVLLAERSADSEIEYIFRPGSFDPLCRLNAGKFQAYHLDQIGMPREITDARGAVVWAATYDPFGTVARLRVAETDNRLRFPGQYDDGTGLFYNHYRYYDPSAARYITQDPLGINAGLNFYRYARNPLVWADPFGLLDPYEVARYGDSGHQNDGMDAHELLQSAWQKENVPAYEGRSAGMGRDNPAMALPPSVHQEVSAEQAAAGLHDAATLGGQTARQNINANADILERVLAKRMSPEDAAERVAAFKKEALKYAKKYNC